MRAIKQINCENKSKTKKINYNKKQQQIAAATSATTVWHAWTLERNKQ